MKILYLSSWFPYPPDNGSKIRIFNQVKELSKDNEVHLICFSESKKDENNVSELKNYCASVSRFKPNRYSRKINHTFLGFFKKDPRYFSTSFTPKVKEAVDDTLVSKKVDLILAEGIGTAEYVLDIKNVPKALDLHNVDSALYKTIAQNRPSILKKIRGYLFWLKFLGYEKRVCEQFDLCIVVSEKERERLIKNAPNAKIMVLPNAIDLNLYKIKRKPKLNTIIFTGTLSYEANMDAVNWFYDSIFPLIKEQKPDVKLIITGEHSTVNVEHLSSDPNIILTGYVEDLPALSADRHGGRHGIHSFIAESSVSIAPIRIGGGSRFKILESMALGTPVVSTTIGAEGIDVTDGENILIADSPEKFANCVASLLNNEKLRKKLSIEAGRLIKEKYNWESIGPSLLSSFEKLTQYPKT